MEFGVGRGWWGCRGSFYHRSVGLWAGLSQLLHQELHAGGHIEMRCLPQALSHPWHLGVCVCVIVFGVFRVKGGGLYFRPETRLPPLPCCLFPPILPLPTLLRLDPVSHLPIHLKAQNTYWDPIWGWGRGAWEGPQQGWKTQQRHEKDKEEVESEGERW